MHLGVHQHGHVGAAVELLVRLLVALEAERPDVDRARDLGLAERGRVRAVLDMVPGGRSYGVTFPVRTETTCRS
jgi:hypothetical protein